MSQPNNVSLHGALIPLRRLQPDLSIVTEYWHADGSPIDSSEAVPVLPSHPVTRITDGTYKLGEKYFQGSKGRRNRDDLLWLNENHPLLFEELLCFLENLTEDKVSSVVWLLNHHGLKPERVIWESHILAFYRHLFDLTPIAFTLAHEGFHGSKDLRASFLFGSARTCCGYTVDSPYFKAALLAVWIMQDVNPPLKNQLWVKGNEADFTFIDERFNDVYDNRHELRMRGTIDASSVEEYLRHDGPLRLGSL